MKTKHEASARGVSDFGWLDSRHSFSFGQWRNPERMGFRSLRVLNDDRVVPGGGFPTHPHADMEILTYVLDGTIAHEDSMGHRTEVAMGELQRMTAGTGVTHSEFNASETDPLHFLQIWVIPESRGLPPSYEQRAIGGEGLVLAASRDGRDGSLTVHQDLDLYLLDGGEARHELGPERHAYIHVATGTAVVNGEQLAAGDALELSGEQQISVEASGKTLLFDLA
ncbi:MAG: pirin family protein [Planctomycetota bacterium]|jgi:redox-sensitive bicupin YhaK (pirin superfamily)